MTSRMQNCCVIGRASGFTGAPRGMLRRLACLVLVVLLAPTSRLAATTLVEAGSKTDWKFVDDGAVVCLNGKVVVRENIAVGPTNSKTAAQRRIDGAAEGNYSRYLVPAASLVAGHNELAVEVHQCDAVSSDLFFDLLLKGYRGGEEPQPVKLDAAAREIALAYRTNHYVSGGQVIPDGYVDGGRRAEFEASGNVKSDREVIVVDRARDPALRKHLVYARSEFVTNLSPLQRARFLALYVDMQCSSPEGRNVSFATLPLVESEFRNRELLLGQSVGTGVCRHRAPPHFLQVVEF